MATVTIRPNGTVASFGTLVGGQPTVHQALSDSSDSTYISIAEVDTGTTILSLDDLPANVFQVTSVVVYWRSRTALVGDDTLYPMYNLTDTSGNFIVTTSNMTLGATTGNTTWQVSNGGALVPSGNTLAVWNGAQLRFSSSTVRNMGADGNSYWLSDFWIEVTYVPLAAPLTISRTVSISTPKLAAFRRQTFDNGTEDATITASHTDSGTPFSNVVITGTAIAQYDSSSAYAGNKGAYVSVTTSDTVSLLRDIYPTTILSSQFFFKLPSLPTSSSTSIWETRSIGNIYIVKLLVSTTGVLSLYGEISAGEISFSPALSTDTWYRIDYKQNSSTGALNVKLRSASGTIIDEIDYASGGWSFANDVYYVTIGKLSSVGGATTSFDEFAVVETFEDIDPPTVSGDASVSATTISRTASFGSNTVLAGQQAAITATTISRTVSLAGQTAAVEVPAAVSGTTLSSSASFSSNTVLAGQQAAVTASTISRTVSLAGQTAAAGTGASISPATIGRTVSLAGQTVAAEAPAEVIASTISRTVSIAGQTTRISVTASPATISRTVSIAGQTVTAGQQAAISPTTISRTVSVAGQTTRISVTASPATISRTVSIAGQTTTAGTGAAVSPATISRAVSIAGQTTRISVTASPATISRTVSLAGTSAQAGSEVTVSPATISRAVSVAGQTTRISVIASPATISRTVSVAGQTVTAGQQAAISPTTIARTVTVAGPSITAGGSADIAPVTITATAVFTGSTVHAGSVTSPGTISSTVTVPVTITESTSGADVSPAVLSRTVIISQPVVSVINPVEQFVGWGIHI